MNEWIIEWIDQCIDIFNFLGCNAFMPLWTWSSVFHVPLCSQDFIEIVFITIQIRWKIFFVIIQLLALRACLLSQFF